MREQNNRKRRLSRLPGSARRFKGAVMTGAALRRMRIAAGASQVTLAFEAGYSVAHIGTLEKGRHRITPRAASILVTAIERLRSSRGTATQ